MKNETEILTRKILKSYHVQSLKVLSRLLERIVILEEKFKAFEHNQTWNEQAQGWLQTDIKEIEKKIERLQQNIDTIELEKMVFDPD